MGGLVSERVLWGIDGQRDLDVEALVKFVAQSGSAEKHDGLIVFEIELWSFELHQGGFRAIFPVNQ